MLNLTSRTANGLTNAERFCGLMSHKSKITESQKSDLMIVLHEGIANTLIKEMDAPSASPRAFL